MSVNDLMTASGPSIYYSDAFRHVLEDHMDLLRRLSSTKTLNVDPSAAYKYEHDLFGFLQMAGISTHLHWVVMRLNKMTSPDEFTIDIGTLMVPDPGVIEKIRQSHMSSRKIT